jgi:hypothetical protein
VKTTAVKPMAARIAAAASALDKRFIKLMLPRWSNDSSTSRVESMTVVSLIGVEPIA